jgi:hypothetical protein
MGPSRSSSSASPTSTTAGSPRSGPWWAMTGTPPTREPGISRSGFRPTCDWASRATACGASPARAGRPGLLRALVGRGAVVPKDIDEANARLAATVRYWRRWLARGPAPRPPLARPDPALALTIKGLTYMPTGATVAAATTSLPETPGGERNWDYRFTGSGTRRSPFRRSTSSTSTGRPTSSCSSWPTSSRTRTAAFRSCTGSMGAVT